jgi:hypothetical protein
MEKFKPYKKENKENLKEKFEELFQKISLYRYKSAQIESMDITKVPKVEIQFLIDLQKSIKNNLLEIAKNPETRKLFKELIKEKKKEIVRIYEDAFIKGHLEVINILEKQLENLTSLEEKFDLIVFGLEKNNESK